MTKKIFLAVFIAAIFFIGCNRETSVFNQTLISDYEAIVSDYPNADLYVVEAKFNENFTTDKPKKLYVITSRMIFQIKDSSVILLVDRNYYDNTHNITFEDGFCANDFSFNPIVLPNVNDAISAMLKANIIVPESNIMVIKNHKESDAHYTPYYVFGDIESNYYVKVDSKDFSVIRYYKPVRRLRNEIK